MWMASIPLFMGCFEICKSQIVNWLNKTKKIKFFKADLHFQFTERSFVWLKRLSR